MIRLNNVSYTYGHQNFHFTCNIEKGERVSILGPSGVGKSTLLNLIAGFIYPQGGTILLNNIDYTQLPPAKRPISMLFQENNLFAHLTVEQNIGLGLNPTLKLNKEECLQRDEIIEQVGLAGLHPRLPAQLSGGQKQRVAIARCLLRKQPILLLDEPFSALDEELRQEMLELVNQLCQEYTITLLMVTHNWLDALSIAPHIMQIDQGKIAYESKIEDRL